MSADDSAGGQAEPEGSAEPQQAAPDSSADARPAGDGESGGSDATDARAGEARETDEQDPGGADIGDGRAQQDAEAKGESQAAGPSATADEPAEPGTDKDGPDPLREPGYNADGGAQLRQATTSGAGSPAFYIERFTQTVSHDNRKVRVEGAWFAQTYIGEFVDTYAPVDGFDDMSAQLAANRVILLRGQVGSGRRATAMALLVGRCQRDSIGMLDTEDDAVLALIADEPELLRRGNGFLIDLVDRPVRQATLDRLSVACEDRDAYIVIVDAATAAHVTPVLDHYEVIHPEPDRKKVLRCQLRYRVKAHVEACDVCRSEQHIEHRDIVADYVRRCLDESIVLRQLPLVTHTRSVAKLAARLADATHEQWDDVVPLIDRWRNQLRDLAKEVLRTHDAAAEDKSAAEPDDVAARRQALRISYAVFDNHPLADVFDAAEQLSQQIHPRPGGPESPGVRLVGDRDLSDLILADMRADTKDNGHDYSLRRARLVDPELMGEVLQVAWHDYDTLRRPLADWLSVLVASGAPRVQIRAASVAGLLMSFDFDDAYRMLVGPWGRAQAPYRQAAALALSYAAERPPLVERIRMRVQDWALSPAPRLQDSAVRAFGTVRGVFDIESTLDHLERLGRRQELSSSFSIAWTMARLLTLDGATTRVLGLLTRWVDEPGPLSNHAVHTLLACTSGSWDHREGWLTLRALLVEDRQRTEAFATLWQRALVATTTSRRAWDRLRRWLANAERGGDGADVAEDLALRVLTRSASGHCCHDRAQRAPFHLHTWRQQSPDSAVLQRLDVRVRTQANCCRQ